MESEIIDYLHSFRKDGQIINAGIKMALNNPIRLIKALPYLADHIFKFPKQIQKFVQETSVSLECREKISKTVSPIYLTFQ